MVRRNKEAASQASPKSVLEAFKRRFLYKIRFDKPSVEARTQIWQILLPALSCDNAHHLASQFDLSGGEIENIARRLSVNAILTGNEVLNMDEIISFCQRERINNTTPTRIGF